MVIFIDEAVCEATDAAAVPVDIVIDIIDCILLVEDISIATVENSVEYL